MEDKEFLYTLIAILFVICIWLGVATLGLSARLDSFEVGTGVIEVLEIQSELNSNQNEINTLFNDRLDSLENSRGIALDLISNLQEEMLFVFRVIDDYIFID